MTPSPDTTSKPPVFYRFSRTRKRWEYAFQRRADGTDWKRSDVVHTKQPVLAEYEIMNIRRQWSERTITFLTSPFTGKATMGCSYSALGSEEQAPKVNPKPELPKAVVRNVLYRRNPDTGRWQYRVDEGGEWRPSWNFESVGAIPTESEAKALRDHWNPKGEKDVFLISFDVAPVRGGYYRFDNGWQYFLRSGGSALGGVWCPSVVYAGKGLTMRTISEIARSGVTITTINGVKYNPAERIPGIPFDEAYRGNTPERTLYPQARAPQAGFETSTGRLSSRDNFDLNREVRTTPFAPTESEVGQQLAAMQRRIERALDYAMASGEDYVLTRTRNARTARGIERAIPLDREWLGSSGDLIDLSLISDEYLSNIVNLVLRGARVTGQEIDRTPERVRQGLNASAEQAKRVLKYAAKSVGAESTLLSVQALVNNRVGGK